MLFRYWCGRRRHCIDGGHFCFFSPIFPWTYSITEDGMVSVMALVTVTTEPRHFHFCFLVTVVLCALGLLNDICGGCTWRRGYMHLQRFLSEIVLWWK